MQEQVTKLVHERKALPRFPKLFLHNNNRAFSIINAET
ncbi:hypothetical protein C7S16_3692 [Burkholderia thailandensis]|uniref:Uncharacterized protein n=1 Tax=Burkholderia thailandensis TaxID=57975 RepID=A0AAW9D277_BURTH|nr:hypothetical protein [Burkholderia thailandensis]MDW9256201.1 hypothetical protein [Burkholderia thailandensis]